MVELDKLTSAVAAALRLGMGAQPSIANMDSFGSPGNQPQIC